MENLELLTIPFFACLIISSIHCYMGLHIVKRGVIFVDLALAQCAVLGTSIASLNGYEPDSYQAYALSICFTLLGAAVFSLGTFKNKLVPHEAIIGIVYVVVSSISILVLDRSPHGLEEIKSMLVGSILFVTWKDIFGLLGVYIVLGILCSIFHKRFWTLSASIHTSNGQMNSKLWNFIFYAIFGIMVTRSVMYAGVLLVFSFLVIPAVCSFLFVNKFITAMIVAWGLALLGSFSGLFASGFFDLPTGAAIVTAFGGILFVCTVMQLLTYKKNYKQT